MHFSAYAYVGESVTDPAKYYRNNVLGTLTLLESMLAASIKNFVFSSTCATYGVPNFIPITEDHPQNPINPYGATKLMVERILTDFDVAYNFKSVRFRYFNAAGANPQGLLGEDHDPETHLIPLVLQTALGQRESISIFGTDYPTPDGTCIRDYIHVNDLADAIFFLLKKNTKESFLNIGTNQEITIKDLANKIKKISGFKGKIIFDKNKPVGQLRRVLDSTKLKKMGWKNKISLHEGLTKVCNNFGKKYKLAHSIL
jgi:UDP-glucose 4-epimerase